MCEWTSIAEAESGAQAIARCQTRPLGNLGIPIFSADCSAEGSVIELYGPEGTGKSSLALHAIVSTILPQRFHGVDLGGCQSGAVLIDLDYKFQLDRLRQCLQGRIRQAFPPARLSPHVLEAVVNDSLARLLIATVADSRQLVATLYALEAVIASKPHIRLLVLDGISALHWIDSSRTGESRTCATRREVARAVTSLKDTNALLVIATKSAIFHPSSYRQDKRTVSGADRATMHKEFMGQDWTAIVSHRFVLSQGAATEYGSRDHDAQSAGSTSWVMSQQYPSKGLSCRFNVAATGVQFCS